MDDSLSENAPSAQGTFAKTPLAHVLIHALHQQLTGTFELSLRGSPSGTFLVIDGHLAKARTMVDHYLLRVMQQVGVLSEGQVHNWLPRLLMSEELHGRALVRKGVLTEEQVELGLRAQLVRQMQTIVELPPDTTWKYFDGIDALAGWGEESPVRLDPSPFVWSSLKQAPPWEHVNAALGRIEGAWLRLRRDTETNAFNFERPQRAVAELLRERPWSLEGLVARAQADVDTVRLVVYCLLLAKSVELVEAPEADEGETPLVPQVAPVARPIPREEPTSERSEPEPGRTTPTKPLDGPGGTSRYALEESVAPPRESPPESADVVSLEASPDAPSIDEVPSRRATPREMLYVVEPEEPLLSDALFDMPETRRTPVPAAPPPLPRPPVHTSETPTLVLSTPVPPPAGAIPTPIPVPPPYPGRRKDPPTLVAYSQDIPPAARPTPVQMPAVRSSPMMPTSRRSDDDQAPRSSTTERPPPPDLRNDSAPTRPPPPDLEEPGYDVPVRPLPPVSPLLATDEEHSRPTATGMAAITPEQIAAYIASLDAEKNSPKTPGTSPPTGRPIALPPPLPPRGPARRPSSPMVFRKTDDGQSSSAPVPPESPPRATGAATSVARPAAPPGSVDISDKAEDRTARVPPLTTRKTLEIPVDRALLDATEAAASSRLAVEVVPSLSTVSPATTPRLPLEIDSPFDGSFDDVAPLTPVREVPPELAEEASGKKPT